MTESAQTSAVRDDPADASLLTEPRARRNYLVWFVMAYIALFAAYTAAGSILVPDQVQLIEAHRHFTGTDAGVDLKALTDLKHSVDAGQHVPTVDESRLLGLLADYESARARSLALVLSLGTFIGLFSQPVIGVISDRHRSKWGRRSPWIVLGAIVGAAALVGLSLVSSIGLVALGWVLVLWFLNWMQAQTTTTMADRIPSEKLGVVSGLAGFGQMVGIMVGAIVAGILFGRIGLTTYDVFAATVAVGAVLFVVLAPDRPSTDLEVAPFNGREFLRSFTIALRDHDFRWVWFARMLLIFGYGTTTTFNIYLLQSYIRPGVSLERANALALLLQASALPLMLVGLLLSGRWSDKLGRRKPFVIWSSVGLAVAIAIPLLWPTLPAMFAMNIIGGACMGPYMAIDQALFIDVLPDKDASGRDLGVANVATNLGQTAAPPIWGRRPRRWSVGSWRRCWRATRWSSWWASWP